MRRRTANKVYRNILSGRCKYRAKTGGRAVRVAIGYRDTWARWSGGKVAQPLGGTLSDAELYTVVQCIKWLPPEVICRVREYHDTPNAELAS